ASYAPSDGILKENVPTASSSDLAVRAHRFTLAARSEISAPEWFTTTKRTSAFFLGSSIRRIPTTSTYFCSMLVWAFDPPGAPAFSSVFGALAEAAPEPEKCLMPKNTPAPTARNRTANTILISHGG